MSVTKTKDVLVEVGEYALGRDFKITLELDRSGKIKRVLNAGVDEKTKELIYVDAPDFTPKPELRFSDIRIMNLFLAIPVDDDTFKRDHHDCASGYCPVYVPGVGWRCVRC